MEIDYGQLMDEHEDEKRTKLKATMMDAVSTAPEQHAKILDLSKKTGLTPDLVKGHESELDQKVKQKSVDYGRLMDESPKTAEFLSNPDNAKLAQNDVENLSWFETIGRGIGNRASNVSAGFTRFVGKTSAELAQEIEERLPLGTLVINSEGISWRQSREQDFEGQGFVQGATNYLEGLAEDIDYKPGTSWEDVKQSPLSEFLPFAIEQGLVSIPDMAGVLINLPAYVAARTGELGDERAKNDQRNEATIEDFVTVAPFAIGSAFLEKLGTKGIIGLDDVPITGLKDLPGAITKASVKEAGTEAVQEGLESTSTTVGTEKGFQPAETLEQMLAGAVGGGPFGGIVRGTTGLGEIYINRVNADKNAIEGRDKLVELSERAKQSELYNLDKEIFAEFFQSVSEDKEVFIDVAGALNAFKAANVNPADVYNEMGVIGQVGEATARGGDMVVPIGQLMKLADQEYFNELLQDVRLNQGDMTAREASANQEAYQEYIQELAAEAENRREGELQFTSSADLVYDEIRAQLEATGKFTPEVANQYALLHRAAAVAISDRAGVMPHEIYQKYGLKIVDDSLTQDQINFVNTIRKGKTPNQRDIYGEGLIQFLANRGGIVDDGGELAARDADKFHKGKPGQKKLVTDNGMTIDEALEAAIEAGYIRAETGTALQDDLLNAIDSELAGETVFSENNINQDLLKESEQIEQAIAQLEEQGIDLSFASNRDIIQALYGNNTTDTILNDEVLPDSLKEQAGPDVPSGDFDPAIFQLQAFQDQSAYDENGEVITESEAFKKWAGTDKPVIDPDDINDTDFSGEGPFILRAYHGTTNDFEAFDASIKGTKEGQFGAVNYFTSSEYDANDNYAGEGPDLTSRIDRLAEEFDFKITEIIDKHETINFQLEAEKEHGIDYDAEKLLADELKSEFGEDLYNEDIEIFARNLAKKELHGGAAQVLELFIKTEKPFIVGTDESPWHEFFNEEEIDSQAIARVADTHDLEVDYIEENRDEYEDEIYDAAWEIKEEEGNPLIEAIETVASKYDVNPADVLESMYDVTAEGEIQHSNLEKYLRENEQLSYAEDPEDGSLVSSHMIGEIIQELGYDSIILKDANQRFENMNMVDGTAHIHVFDANNTNIKSVNNRGTFDPNDPRILYQSENNQNIKDEDLPAMLREQAGLTDEQVNVDPNDASIPDVLKLQAFQRKEKVKPLTESKFFSRYAQHIDVRNRGKTEAEKVSQDILKNGFKKGMNVNAMPPYRGGESVGIGARFAPKTGDYVYLAPKGAWKDKANGMEIEDGWIPEPYEVIKVESDNPDMYQEYLKAVEIYNNDQDVFGQGVEVKRGSIQIPKSFPHSPAVINLFEDANLSTFLHESGHFFLEVYKDIVSQDNAPQSIQDDFNAILEWMGVNSADEIDIDQHEQFARGFEAYLYEGKAPSAELQSVFSRFRAWLLQVYRSLRNLNVELNDEVRGVFDRILATDEAIEETDTYLNNVPLFRDAEAAGWTEAEHEAYIKAYGDAKDARIRDLEKQNLDEIKREERQAYKDEKEQVSNEVAETLAKDKAHRVKHFLMYGEMPNGEETPAGIEPLKLSKQILIDRYGTDGITRRLPQGRNRITSDEGIDPEIVAGMFGFRSADEMIKAIVAIPSFKQAVTEQTNQIMKDRHGDLMGKQADMTEAAIDAAHNDETANFLMVELKALEGRTRKKVTPRQVIRSVAQRIIADKQVAKIREGEYIQASLKAARESVEAAAKGNYDLATDAKRRQLLNHYLYMEARDATKAIEKGVKFAKSLKKGNKWKKIQRAGDSYINQVNGVLSSFEFATVTNKELKARQSMRSWIDAVLANSGEGSPVPNHEVLSDEQREMLIDEAREDSSGALPDTDAMDDLLSKYGVTNYRELSYAEFNGVIDSLKMIDHMATLDNKLLTQAEKKKISDWVDELTESIRENARNNESKRLGSTKTNWGSTKQALTEFKDITRTPTSIIKMLDGYKDDGIAFKLFGRPLQDAAAQETEQLNEANEKLKEIFSNYSDKELIGMNKNIYDEELQLDLTKHDVVSILLNWGNAGNKQRVLDGFGLTEVQAKSLMDKYLNENDYNFAKDIWAYLESFKQASFELHKDLFGYTPEEVTPEPFETKYGTMPGGYYPIKYDVTKSAAAEHNMLSNMTEAVSKAIGSRSTLGSNKSRLRKVKRALETDITRVVFGHVSETIHKTTHNRALYDIGRVLGNDSVKNAITESHGEHFYRALTSMVRNIKEGTEPTKDILDRVVQVIRNNATLAMLGGSLRTIVLQPFGITNSIVHARLSGIGVKGLMDGYASYMKNPADMSRNIREKSLYMKNREQSQSVAINRIRNKIKKSSRLQSLSGIEAVRESTMIPMMKAQFYTVDAPMWWAAYTKYSELMDEQSAISLADQAVRDAQGGGNIVDTAEAMQGGPYRKLFTNFLTYMVTTYNLQVRNNADLVDNWGSDKAGNAKALFDYSVNTFVLMTMPSILMAMLNDWVAGDDDDEEFAERVVREQASFILGMNPLTAQVSGIATGFDYSGPQGTAIAGKIVQLSTQVGQGEVDDSLIKSGIWVAGLATGLPAAQINRTIFGIEDAVDDNADMLKLIKQAGFGPEKD